jgi:deferrochelatase/peroxidase EfeB
MDKLTRSKLFAMSAAVGSTAAIALTGTPPTLAATGASPIRPAKNEPQLIPFYGPHQAGITTDQQSHTYFAALDLVTTQRSDLITLLQAWTKAAALMTSGQPVPTSVGGYDAKPIADSGENVGLSPSRLTITIGFGAGMFAKDGVDRYGLAAKRPAAFIDLPKFNGDQLVEARTGGDLSIQACADDPQVAFHAVRQLTRLAMNATQVRWVQAGFVSGAGADRTPRNLMGFKDGTQEPTDAHRFVWANGEQRWMQGGTYLVARRIRIAIEHWDQMNVGFQEQTIGRSKQSGAPLGMHHEADPLPLGLNDKDGNPVIAEAAHVRVANAATNDGIQILRRGYAYNDGVSFVSERWPPWRQAMEYDAGLLFVSYQRDPMTGFIPMFTKMAKLDMLNQFTTHVGGGMFAIPGGVAPGEYLGQRLFN